MKELKAFFKKEYDTHFKLGRINQRNPDFTYFSLTPTELKKQKLKFVIVLDHLRCCFSICLSGQNKSIRKKYWLIFKNSDWNKYHLIESIDNNLMIVDHVLVQDPDFADRDTITERIETESFRFMTELEEVLT